MQATPDAKDEHHAKNALEGDPTDGRDAYDWESRYPREARIQYYWEAAYVGALLVLAMILLAVNWLGWPSRVIGLQADDQLVLTRYSYYAVSGLLGGTVFGGKYLYRVVARGYWSEDRRLWRLLSPWLSVAVAFAVGTFVEAGWLSLKSPERPPTIIGIGFLVGYFSDSALAKMQELADVLFGATVAASKTKK